MEIIITNLCFGLLFVGLFIYQMKNSNKREKEYQETIHKIISGDFEQKITMSLFREE